ncbi:MAG: Ig-like domain-containing protein [Planctomycetota bacterium]
MRVLRESRKWICGIAAALVAAGCSGGSSGGGSGPQPDPPLVTGFSPPDDPTGLTPTEPTVVLTVTFDTGIDPATLTDQTFLVDDPVGAVAGTVIYDDTTFTATFTPAQALLLDAEHTATVTTDVTSVDGLALKQETSWSFAVRAGAWGPAMPLNFAQAVNEHDFHAAAAADGRVWVVWKEGTGSAMPGIWAKRIAPDGTALDNPEPIGPGDACDPRVGVDGDGNAICVWGQVDAPGGGERIYANCFDGTAWGTPTTIDGHPTDPENTGPRLAVIEDGRAIVVWEARDNQSGVYLLQTAEFDPVGGWSDPAGHYESESVVQAFSYEGDYNVGANENGDAVVTGTRKDSMTNRRKGRKKVIRIGDESESSFSGLGPEVPPSDPLDPFDVEVGSTTLVVNDSILVIWIQQTNCPDGVSFVQTDRAWSARYVPSVDGSSFGTWKSATLVDGCASDDSNGFPGVALAPDGVGRAVWQQSTSGGYRLGVNETDSAGVWQAPGLQSLQELCGSAASEDHRIVLDPTGLNGFSVWLESSGCGAPLALWARPIVDGAYVGPTQWLDACTGSCGAVGTPQVTVDPSGRFTALWRQSQDGTTKTWFARFQ